MATRKTALQPAFQCWNLMWSQMRLRVLMTALELKVFDVLTTGPATAAEVAKNLKASLRGTTMLLDELAALNLLKKSKTGYTLSAESETFLVSTSDTYMGHMLQHAHEFGQAWENLTDVVRTGKPFRRVDDTERSPEFFKILVRGLYAASYVSANLLLPFVTLKDTRNLHVLDVAAGSAAWSLPFAEKLKANVTVLDLPGVIDVAKEFADRHGVGDRFDYLEGDLRKLNFGTEKFDVIILGHIVHSEGPKWSEKLIAKCSKALKKGGVLVIPDMIPNDQRTGPEFPLLFALNMLLHTIDGNTFTAAEYKQWLKNAGLRFEKILPAETVGTQVILARK